MNYCYSPLKCPSSMNTTQMETIKEFFTDDQWDAISSALNDYQDYGTEESEIADSIQDKIAQLFKN